MNNGILIIVLLLTCNICFAQNLVPNPSFEDTTQCPNYISQMNRCLSWGSYSGATPDYFHFCSSEPGITPPDTWFGYQAPVQGNAYSGIQTFATNNSNYRELIVAQLISPLQTGIKYFVSFYLAKGSAITFNIATNKIGVRFTNLPFTFSPSINNFAHIYTDSILTDSTNWFQVKGSFIADSNYAYVVLGNFFDDLNTDTINFDFSSAAYYL